MFNILYVNPISKISGAEFSLLGLMGNLNRELYSPILLCPDDGPLPRLCRKQSIPTIFLPTLPPPAGRTINTYLVLMQNIVAIRRIIRDFEIALIHSNTPRVAYHGGLAGRWARIPTVTHVRDISSSPFDSRLKARFLDAISDHIIAISAATRETVVQHITPASSKISVIYNGVNPAVHFTDEQIKQVRAEFSLDADTCILIKVAQIAPWKGQSVAIRAMPTILEKYPNTVLLIVGEPLWDDGKTYYQELLDLCDQLRLGRHVVFTGFRSDSSLLMTAADVLVHTPVEPEPLGRVLLEAGIQKTTIIASNAGGIPEIVLDNETGILIPPGQPDALTEAVVRVFDNPTLALALQTAAYKRTAELFSVEQYARRVESIYASLLY